MENMFNRIYPALTNFPKSEKFAITQDVKNCFLEYLTYIARADKIKSKRLTYAQEAEGYLQKIKTLMKFARNRKYVSKGFYKDISLELTEVSKMLAAYIRSTKK